MHALLTNPILYWGASIVVVLALSAREATQCGLDPRVIYMAGLLSLAGAVGGGLLYNWVISPAAAQPSWGTASIGAFAGAGLFASLMLKLMAAPTLPYANAATPAIALGYATYRIGCFVNGCCFGTESAVPWSVVSHPGQGAYEAQLAHGLIAATAAHSLPVHPTQLYHAAIGLLSFLVLLRMRRKQGHARLAAALGIYGASRVGIEFMRGDAHPTLGPFDANQFGAALMLVMGGVLWYTQRHQAVRPPSQMCQT